MPCTTLTMLVNALAPSMVSVPAPDLLRLFVLPVKVTTGIVTLLSMVRLALVAT